MKCPYRTRAKARMMSEIEEVHEQMKVDMEAMKEQRTTLMKAMMSMRKMMEVNTTTEVDPTHPSGLNQVNRPVSDMVGQVCEAFGSTGDPHFVQVQSKHSFPPYGLPPNYTPPNVAHAPDENVDNSTPISLESQLPQSSHAHVSQPMGETPEVPRDHTLVDFEPHLGYAIEGHAFGGIPLPNNLGGPQYRPQPQPLHFALERLPSIVMNSSDRRPGENGESKKEGGTHAMTVVPTWPNFPPPQNPPTAHPIPNTTLNTNQNTNQGRNFPKKKLVEFTPISVSYANLLSYLLNNAMVAIILAKVPQPPFSRGENSNAKCAYHGGVPGHSIEHCMTLKQKVQSLIDASWL
ncbi:hypothetical protein HKD37_03G006882 [Glycine soja]